MASLVLFIGTVFLWFVHIAYIDEQCSVKYTAEMIGRYVESM